MAILESTAMHSTRWGALSLLLLCVFSTISVRYAEGFTFNVDATKEECFYEEVAEGTAIGVMFQVTQGGFLDIDIQVSST